MFPGKENLIFFENLSKTQSQLFADACDYGVEVTPGSDTWGRSAKKNARMHLMALMKIYPYILEKNGNDSTTTLFIPFEFDGGAYVGVNLRIDFLNYTKGRQFLSIDIEPAQKTHTEFEGYKNATDEENGTYISKRNHHFEDDQAAYEADSDYTYEKRQHEKAWAEAAFDAKRFN